MTRFILRRTASGILTLIAISFLVFALFYLVPGDPAKSIAGLQALPAQVEAIRAHLGLDQPVWQRYFGFIMGILRGDLGYSFFNQQPVITLIEAALPVTVSVAVGGLAVALLIGIVTGAFSGRNPGGFTDRIASLLVLTGLSVPTFVVGLFLLSMLFYALTVAGLPIFPASGYVSVTQNPGEWARHLILPWLTVGLTNAAVYARLTRSQVIGAYSQAWVDTAIMKGLRPGRIFLCHVLRASLIPIVTQLGLDLAALLGGLIVTEQLFGLNGVGRLSVQAVVKNDQPVIIAVVLLASAFIIIINLLTDLLYPTLDPRVRST